MQYDGQGDARAAYLDRVVLENRPLGEYHIECEQGQRVTYYWSSNR
jgi:3-dehydroquinate synthase class II